MVSLKQLYVLLVGVVLLAGCASLTLREPVRVTVAGLDPLPSEGLEARFIIKLRVQNPNDMALDFNGVAVDLELAGMDFASGVSDQRGSVPRYGEAVIAVPVTVPATAIIRQVIELSGGKPVDRIDYRLRGHLGGIGLTGARFDTRGELRLPEQSRRNSH